MAVKTKEYFLSIFVKKVRVFFTDEISLDGDSIDFCDWLNNQMS